MAGMRHDPRICAARAFGRGVEDRDTQVWGMKARGLRGEGQTRPRGGGECIHETGRWREAYLVDDGFRECLTHVERTFYRSGRLRACGFGGDDGCSGMEESATGNMVSWQQR